MEKQEFGIGHLINTEGVSKLTGVPVPTLRWWRFKGDFGPKSFTVGRSVRYKHSDVVAWLQEQYAAAGDPK